MGRSRYVLYRQNAATHNFQITARNVKVTNIKEPRMNKGVATPISSFLFCLFVLPDVLSQTLMNVVRPIPLKWTNAIRTHLALIPRALTTVLAILRLWEMILVVNFSLVIEGDEIFILFPTLNVAINCLEFTFTSRRHNFTLPCAQERINVWLCFKWF